MDMCCCDICSVKTEAKVNLDLVLQFFPLCNSRKDVRAPCYDERGGGGVQF